MTTVTIIAENAKDARAKLVKLQARAARYGQSITFTFSPVREVERKTVDPAGRKITYAERFIDVEVEGEAPRVGKHVLLASLEREAGGVIVNTVPGSETEVGNIGRKWDGRCDHCKVSRTRTKGFVVADGKHKLVVGRSCLRDYLGIDVPEGVLSAFQFARDLRDMGDPDELGGLGWRDPLTVTASLLTATSAAIDLWGWSPASGSADHGDTTKGRVALLSRTDDLKGLEKQRRQQLEAELRDNAAKHAERAAAVIAWGRNDLRPGNSDYLHNLKLLLACDTVQAKRAGYVCSAVTAYERDQGRKLEAKREAANAPASHHVEAVGDRLATDVTVERIVALPDYGFGCMSIYCMRQANGALLSWKTSPDAVAVQGVGVGDQVKLTGTVKAHADFKGTPETRLTRCRLVKAEVAA